MTKLPPHTGINFTNTTHSSIPPSLDPSKHTLPNPFVVCITGASRGIGAATALSFALAGASGLILTARNADNLIATRNFCARSAKIPDLRISCLAATAGANEDEALRIAQVIESQHNGRLDLLINNAGTLASNPTAFAPKLHDIDLSQIQEAMEIHYLGPFLTTKHLMPFLLKSESGLKMIINISSIGSHVIVPTAPMGYCASVVALNRLTEWTAKMYQEDGVLAYAVHPGKVKNEIPVPGLPEWMRNGGEGDDAGICGAFILWLVRERPEWLSGRYLSANWDVDELKVMREEVVEKDLLKARMRVE